MKVITHVFYVGGVCSVFIGIRCPTKNWTSCCRICPTSWWRTRWPPSSRRHCDVPTRRVFSARRATYTARTTVDVTTSGDRSGELRINRWRDSSSPTTPTVRLETKSPVLDTRNWRKLRKTVVVLTCSACNRYWYCPHSMRKSVYETVRCPSVCREPQRRTLLLWPAGRRYRSIAARRTVARQANAGSATLSAYVVTKNSLVVGLTDLHTHIRLTALFPGLPR